MPKRDEPKTARTAHLPRVRCTEAERLVIETKAQDAGLRLTEYLRQCILRARVVVREERADPELVRQLLAIGNNLNQLTKHAHVTDSYDRQRLHQILNALEALVMRMID